ncbi:trypsin-like peptidase domain-containing protein [Thiocapsa bogorovii]|uniref:trypsin-like peptidase domain-containing protein n=1 Tax=Thiocapsa bogorovii TaxID=521689 RepID=UPI001E46EC45|nr:trypsin-like peptidase domain-containing protein [Thiocapsa bogorovii]UHD16368.1 serine protease [Thiocapsa bogorovii]
MSDWERHLPDADLDAVRKAVIDAGLSTGPILDAISQVLAPLYRGMLPGFGLPSNLRLFQELHAMNRVHNLRNGDVPLEQWLSSAVALAGDLEQVGVLERALDRVRDNAPELPPADKRLTDAAQLDRNVSFEARIAEFDATLEVKYLQQGLKAAASVVKLLVPRFMGGNQTFGAGQEPLLSGGTGWLIGPGLLITNHHVIHFRRTGFLAEADATPEDLALQVQHTEVLFDYLQKDHPSASCKLGPSSLLASDKTLDFAILRLPPEAPQRDPLRLRSEPIRKRMDAALSACVNILQHPNGEPMRLGFRDNFVVVGDDDTLSYLTDTDFGSSGSPVCDDAWWVAALHRGSREIAGLGIEIRGRPVRRENYGVPIAKLLGRLAQDHPPLHAEILAGQA